MPTRSPRLRYEGLDRVSNNEQGICEIIVKLSFGEKNLIGRYQGAIGEESESQAAACAALLAVEEFVQHRFDCSLIDIDYVEAIGSKLIVLLVKVCYEERELQIFGSCRAGNNPLDASARAALDATNRYVELALAGEQSGAVAHDKPPAADLTC